MLASQPCQGTACCPSPEELAAFNSGKLADAAWHAVRAHLEGGCRACHATLQAMEEKADTLAVGLRQSGAPLPFAGEAECRLAMDRLQDFSPAPQAGLGDYADCLASAALDNAAWRPSLGRLDQYELLDKLGQGAMGTIYRALHRRLK